MALRLNFQNKLFLTAFATAALALVVAGLLFTRTMRRQTEQRIEQTLAAEARLATALLNHEAANLDAEADRLGLLIGARVTLIAADGRVVES